MMTELNTDSLLKLNSLGLIPGPDETPASFADRTAYCQNLSSHLPEELKTELSGDGKQNRDILVTVNKQLKPFYDCAPGWIPLFFTNHKLPFWQGGCAWIFQMTENSPVASLIQLRKEFAAKETYLGIYERKELLRHELCHVGRMTFQEPKYEEIIAYRTSNSGFRRFFGPLVQSSAESALFLLLLFMIIVFDIFLIALDRPDAMTISLWIKGIPFLLIIAALWRLQRRQKTFDACLKHVADWVGREHAQSVVYRLTDKEIEAFACMQAKEIQEYALKKREEELRWEVIWKAYSLP